MPIFMFRSEKDRRQYAMAADISGTTLPEHLGPWYRSSKQPIPSFVGLPESVRTAIKTNGHVLMQIEHEPTSLERRSRQRPR